MVSIETNAKKLAQLEKKKIKLDQQHAEIVDEIDDLRGKIREQLSKCGLDTNFF